MKTLPATKARANLYSLIDESAHEPIQITTKRESAILVSLHDWNAIQETLFLLSGPKMRESIRIGLATPINKCATSLKW